MAWPRRAAWVITTLTGLVVIGELAAVVVAGRLIDRLYVGAAAAVAVGTAALGLLVAARRPANLVAPLLSWMALLAAVTSFSDTYAPAQARRPDLLPALPPLVVAILVVTWVWLYVAVALLMLVFPDGRLPGRRWRVVAAGLPVVAVLVHLVMLVSPGPYDAPYAAAKHPFGDLAAPLVLGLKAVLFTALVGLLAAATLSLWLRFRHGDEVRRAQLKWFALAGVVGMALTMVLSWGGFVVLGTHALAGIGIAVLYAGLPLAAAVAILRHELYDVDRAISTTVTYAMATFGLLAVFAAASFVSGLLVGRHSVVVAAAATAVVALALAPLRTRLQRGVDRRLYPLRRAVLTAVDDLRARINAGEARPEELEAVLRTALRDPSLRIGFAVPGSVTFLDVTGGPATLPDTAVSIDLGGQRIGVVAADRTSRQLLREIADAAALLVEVIRLRLELTAALHEVEASRARLQRLGYDERHRLERDLHDGAQQRLVSLGMALRLAQRHLGDGSVDVDGLLDQAVAELATAVAELRQVAHGLRPSALDDGLHPALSSLTRTLPLPVDLHIDSADAVPEDVATTAYYVVNEAVTNTVKHAQARRIGPQVVQDDGALHVRVEDDGRGGAWVRPGSGLAGLADRVAATGGSLLVHSPAGRGTVIEAVLPCAS